VVWVCPLQNSYVANGMVKEVGLSRSDQPSPWELLPPIRLWPLWKRLPSWASMAHTYNSSCLLRLRSGGLWFKAGPIKKLVRPLSQPKLVQWHVPVIPSYMKGWDWEDHSSSPTQAKIIPETSPQWKKPGHSDTFLSSYLWWET
jgi:hypothetical protein